MISTYKTYSGLSNTTGLPAGHTLQLTQAATEGKALSIESVYLEYQGGIQVPLLHHISQHSRWEKGLHRSFEDQTEGNRQRAGQDYIAASQVRW